MKIWMVASFSGGVPGESDVDLFLDPEKAQKEFEERIKCVKDSFDEDQYEQMECSRTTFYYDAGDIWEYITIEEREVV